MYPYNHPYRPEDELAGAVLTWGSLIFGAIYVISVLATHLLLYYVVNPYLLDGKLDEDDNLVLVASAGLWTLIAAVAAPPMFVVGTAWGLLVGIGIVIWTWWSIDTPAFEPVPGFAEVTGLPGEHYLPLQASDQEERDLTLDELEAMILGPKSEEFEPEPYESGSNGRQPVPVAVSQSNMGS